MIGLRIGDRVIVIDGPFRSTVGTVSAVGKSTVTIHSDDDRYTLTVARAGNVELYTGP